MYLAKGAAYPQLYTIMQTYTYQYDRGVRVLDRVGACVLAQLAGFAALPASPPFCSCSNLQCWLTFHSMHIDFELC